MELYICEGGGESGLFPLTHTRPTFNLLCGSRSLKSRIEAAYGAGASLLGVRSELHALTAEAYPDAKVNQRPEGGALIVNGRALWSSALVSKIPFEGPDALFTSGEGVVAVRISHTPEEVDNWADPFTQLKSLLPSENVEATLVRYPWDLVKANGNLIISDAEGMDGLSADATRHNGGHFLSPEHIILGEDVQIGAGVVIDGTDGAVILGRGAAIGHNAVISGPVYIGPGTTISAGSRIHAGTTFGPVCKVGGEVSHTIVQGYSNKQHDGFLGHSYVGSWVNLGAGTTNSNLKNNYANVTMPVDDIHVDTGEIFIGVFIGDHTKTGIGTLLNTGTSLGVGCNIFGGGLISGQVPNFSWGGTKGLEPYRIDKLIEVTKTAMARRQELLTSAEETLLRQLAADSS